MRRIWGSPTSVVPLLVSHDRKNCDGTKMKFRLLQELDQADYLEAHDIAEILGVSYPAASMALLRLVRQNLAIRYQDPDSQLNVYEITPKGEARPDYFLEAESDDE